MQSVGLVLARGGSKGIPGKNLVLLAAEPLIAHTIRAGLESMLDRVIVSTDSYEIAETAQEYGAEVPFMRPKSLATDTSPPDDAEHHALDWLEEHDSLPDAFVRLQPTSPFRGSRDINTALDMLAKGAGAVVGISEMPVHPWLTVQCKPDGRLAFHPKFQQPRQAYPTSVALNGAIYAACVDYYRRYGFYGPETCGLMMPPERSLDIDTLWDLRLARGVA